MSYTSEELKEIAENIEAFRAQELAKKKLTVTKNERLHYIVKDLYKISHGVYTKEAEEEYISHYNSST